MERFKDPCLLVSADAPVGYRALQDRLIAEARGLPPRVAARGLRWESAVIVALAARLARRLRHGDPLATRVGLGKNDFAAAFLTGILARQR